MARHLVIGQGVLARRAAAWLPPSGMIGGALVSIVSARYRPDA